jgi:predicted nuclease of restriction endonuclease-like (RecB) superfamily
MKGFSFRNLKYMRQFAETYLNPIGQQPVAQIPWGHNVILLDKLDSLEKRLWYAQKTIEHGWSRNILTIQIETKLYERQATSEKINNFGQNLPAPQSDLAHQLLKDPYVFDFLSVGQEAQEREIENALVQHITKFLLELGTGFAFVGQQYHLEIGGDDFYIDLLFYHLKLRCYVVIDLKAGKFKPADAGQINFYLSAVDDLLRHPSDNPSIGILLCKDKNGAVAEYALKDVNKPIGVSAYQIVESIPEPLKTSLPTIEQLEAELGQIEDE